METIAGATSGIDLGNLDQSCNPCQDFFQYANGGWIEKHPLPPAYPAYGAFTDLDVNNRKVLQKILEETSSSHSEPGSIEQKVGDFYASGMDEAARERLGITPLAPLFARIDGLTEIASLPELLAHLDEHGSGGFFEFGSAVDWKNSTMMIAGLSQGGLGLPNRDYYFNTDEASARLRDAYLAHVTKMFTLLGENDEDAAAKAKAVMAIELDLAHISLSPVDLRDPEKLYHKMDTAAVTQLAPNFDWPRYFSAFGIAPQAINVSTPGFISEFSRYLTKWNIEDIRTYLRWHLVHNYAAVLPKAFEEARFEFYLRTLRGSKELLPLWQRCVAVIDEHIGEALGQVYVAKTFSPHAKARVIEMVQSIKAAFRDEIAKIDWMTETTRAKAIAKLDALTLKIGYPDRWRDYSSLTISRASYVENVLASRRFNARRSLAKINKPVDKSEWFITPSTVNAYYNPTMNEMVFPAGILQPPFFIENADPAVNYGAIGAVIAHELTHGFDDSGRKFDSEGNIADWWEPADAENFEKRKQAVVDLFDSLESIPGVFQNGRLVVGEAIADLGGARISYQAFQHEQSRRRRHDIDGFTPEQRFFLGFASIWSVVQSDEFSRYQALVDHHPHCRFRVNATLSNIPEFAQAWSCPIGPMSRPSGEQCQLW